MPDAATRELRAGPPQQIERRPQRGREHDVPRPAASDLIRHVQITALGIPSLRNLHRPQHLTHRHLCPSRRWLAPTPLRDVTRPRRTLSTPRYHPATCIFSPRASSPQRAASTPQPSPPGVIDAMKRRRAPRSALCTVLRRMTAEARGGPMRSFRRERVSALHGLTTAVSQAALADRSGGTRPDSADPESRGWRAGRSRV